jgi:tetratricopeptide (TPR) repeat protein
MGRLKWVVVMMVLGQSLFGQSKSDLERPDVLIPVTASMTHRAEEETHREALRLYAQGMMHERADRLLIAQELLEKAAKLDPDAIGPQRALASLYLTLNRPSEALTSCRWVLKHDPNDFRVAYQAAKLLKQAGDAREAKTILTSVVATARIQSAPERLIVILDELVGLSETLEQPEEQLRWLKQLETILTDKREVILLSAELRIQDIDQLHTGVLERIGNVGAKLKRFSEAMKSLEKLQLFLTQRGEAGANIEARRIHWNLCELCCAQERWEEALKHLDQYLEQRPARLEPYERKVELLRLLKRDSEVISFLRKTSEGDPYHTGLQTVLAKELGRSPKTEAEAETIFQGLAERTGKAEIYLEWFRFHRDRKQLSKTLDILEETVQITEQTEPKDLKSYYRAKDRWASILQAFAEDQVLVRAILTTAKNEITAVPSKIRHAELLKNLGGWSIYVYSPMIAEVFFETTIQHHGSRVSPIVRVWYLDSLQAQRKWDEVIRVGSAWLEENSDPKLMAESLSVRIQLAWALVETGKTSEALKVLDACMGQLIGPDKIRLQCQRLQMLSTAGQGSEAMREAEKLLDSALGSDANMVRMSLSHIYLQQHLYEKSEQMLREMIAKDANDSLALNNLGYQMAERGVKLAESEALIRKAIEFDKLAKREGKYAFNPAYLDSLAWVRFKLGHTAEAKEMLQKVVEHPAACTDPVSWEHLGDVLWEMGEVAQAKIAYQTALPFMEKDSRCRKEGRLEKLKERLKK